MPNNPIRSAIGEALDFPFAEAGFLLVDAIESVVNEYDNWDDAYLALDVDSLCPYTANRIETWRVVGAAGAAAEEGVAEPTTDALALIALDLQVVINRAAEAGYAARVDAAFEELGSAEDGE